MTLAIPSVNDQINSLQSLSAMYKRAGLRYGMEIDLLNAAETLRQQQIEINRLSKALEESDSEHTEQVKHLTSVILRNAAETVHFTGIPGLSIAKSPHAREVAVWEWLISLAEGGKA